MRASKLQPTTIKCSENHQNCYLTGQTQNQQKPMHQLNLKSNMPVVNEKIDPRDYSNSTKIVTSSYRNQLGYHPIKFRNIHHTVSEEKILYNNKIW